MADLDTKQLIRDIGAEHRMSLDEAKMIVDKVLDRVRDTAAKGGKIYNLGTFKVTHRPARMARNPRTGEKIKVAARNALHFKPSTVLMQKAQ